MKFWFTFLQTLPPIELPQAWETSKVRDADAHPLLLSLPAIQPAQPPLAQLGGLGGLLFFPGLIVALLFLLFASLFAYTRVYTIAPTNEAFVRTGGIFAKSKSVILNGGCIVLPGFHELTRVPLGEISIDVIRAGNQAVRTQDYLRANMRVTFYVCINADKESVLIAAQRLSKKGMISTADIKEAIEKRADDAIRAAAKKKSLAEIDSDKKGFSDAVLNLIDEDLKKVGLTLNNIAISEIEESDTYDENNFFDAQGVKLRTETIQRSIQQKREVELTTRVAIESRELQAEKQSLEIAKQKENANLTQKKDIEFLKAQSEREIQASKDREAAKVAQNKILQEQSVEEESIQKKLAVQQKQIEADIELEERNKQLKVAQTLQLQAAEVAEITRQKTIQSSQLEAQAEVAAAEQASRIAQQQAQIAIATKEKERLVAEAERAQAESAVATAAAVEQAERQQKLATIEAEKEAQQRRIADQNVVEIDVFRRRRQAEIARQAAELEAESIQTLAEANRYKSLAEAEGKLGLIQAENALNNANRLADVIKTLWPELAGQLPDIVKALAPQPGVLGDARIYSFPGLNGGDGSGSPTRDINQILLSTSGLALIESMLEEGKLGKAIANVKDLLTSSSHSPAATPSASSPISATAPQPSPPKPGKAEPAPIADSLLKPEGRSPELG